MANGVPDLKWIENVNIQAKDVEDIREQVVSKCAVINKEELADVVKYIDLTSLAGNDTPETINKLCKKAISPLKNSERIQHCPAVCVYPVRVKDAIDSLGDYYPSQIKVASVAAGFPSGQLPLELKLEEIKYAIGQGANEIDVVINRTLVLTKQWEKLYNEISEMKKCCGEKILMKTILATGDLDNWNNVFAASKIAILAGSDFIKTSTGKEAVNAFLPMGIVMCKAISEHYKETGKKVGFKPAGGIKTCVDALSWLQLIKLTLGDEWVNSNLFRIGASSLLNDLDENIK